MRTRVGQALHFHMYATRHLNLDKYVPCLHVAILKITSLKFLRPFFALVVQNLVAAKLEMKHVVNVIWNGLNHIGLKNGKSDWIIVNPTEKKKNENCSHVAPDAQGVQNYLSLYCLKHNMKQEKNENKHCTRTWKQLTVQSHVYDTIISRQCLEKIKGN